MTPCPSFEELNALVDGCLRPDRELEVRRHLDRCAPCSGTIAGVDALKRAVGRAYENETPPPALRHAIVAAAHQRRSPWHWWAIAALLLATLSAQLFRGDHGSVLNSLLSMLVADHIEALTTPEVLDAAIEDPQRLSGWFQDRLAYPVSIKSLPDWRLVGGRETLLFGQPAAVAWYERSGEHASLFMTNVSAAAANHPIRQSYDAVGAIRCHNIKAYRVCLHREGDMLVGIVADGGARPEQLLPIAKSS